MILSQKKQKKAGPLLELSSQQNRLHIQDDEAHRAVRGRFAKPVRGALAGFGEKKGKGEEFRDLHFLLPRRCARLALSVHGFCSGFELAVTTPGTGTTDDM